MATVTKPIALDESFNTTEVTPRNIADVLAEGLSHITGRTASEVEYDNTDSGLTADNVQDALDEIAESVPTLPTTDIQTAVDEFSTYNGGLLSSCKVALSPNQDLHGYPEPWVGGAGVQLIDFSNPLGVSSTLDIDYTDGDLTLTANSATGLYDLAIFDGSILVGKTTYMKQTKLASASNIGHWQVVYKVNGEYVWIEVGSNPSATFAITVPSTATECVLRLLLRNGASVQQGTWVKYSKIMVATVQNPEWSPYSNICPISGHTQVEVGDDGKNRFNPNSYESFDVTGGGAIRYGHEFDSGEYTLINNGTGISAYFYRIVAKDYSSYGTSVQITNNTSVNVNVDDAHFLRVFTASWDATVDNIAVIEGTDETFVPYNGYQLTVNLGGTYYSGTLDVVSGELTVDSAFIASYNGETLPSTWISDRDVYAVGTTPTTGAEVCYKLATPQSIQLSPTMVKALVGENHLDAPLDGQEITESKYKQMFTFDDVIAYIQSLS